MSFCADAVGRRLPAGGRAPRARAQGMDSAHALDPRRLARIASRTVAPACLSLLAVTAIGGNLRQHGVLGHVHLGKALKLLGQILVRFNEIAQR